MEEETQSGDDPPFDGNTTQPMEAQQFNVDTQPNQNSGETIIHISTQSLIAAQNSSPNLYSPSRMVANQPTLNTPDQTNTQPHTEPETTQPNLAHISSHKKEISQGIWKIEKKS